MRAGIRLGVDVGQARVGLSQSDPSGILAHPVETLPRDLGEFSDVAKIVIRAKELGVLEIVVGLPTNMDGTEGASARHAREYAGLLACRMPDTPVRLVDERLSTVRAHASLRSVGMKTKAHRKVVDQVAAVDILQHALDTERSTGRAAGVLALCADTKGTPS